MSGRKRSKFQLKQEREEKLRILRTIHSLQTELDALKAQINKILNETSTGLSATFEEEVKGARSWMKQLDTLNVKSFDMKSDIDEIRQCKDELEKIASAGRRVSKELFLAFTEKADEKGRFLSRDLAEIEQIYRSGIHLLKSWYGESNLDRWQRRLDEAKDLLEREQYKRLEEELTSYRQELEQELKFANEQEEKHQKRLYLLKALRQVCMDMGFREVSKPHYEREGDRGSRIMLTVDTFDRGKIDFVLSLDGISSFSEVSEDRCFEEFDQISKFLDEEFGIKTEFTLDDGTRPPKLIRKGELDLPTDTGMQAKA